MNTQRIKVNMPDFDPHVIEVGGVPFLILEGSICHLFERVPGKDGRLVGTFSSAEVAKTYLAALTREDLSTMSWAERNGIERFFPGPGWGKDLKRIEGTFFQIERVSVIMPRNPFAP